MLKDVGAKCPACKHHPCAEYTQMNGEPQWECPSCGENGRLNGKISLAHAAKTPMAAPPPPQKVAPKGLVRYFFVAVAAFLLTLAVIPANAGVYRGEGFTIELTEQGCTSPAAFMMLMASGVASEPKMAIVRANGRADTLNACWAVLDEEDYLVITDSGIGGTIPRVAVQKTRLSL